MFCLSKYWVFYCMYCRGLYYKFNFSPLITCNILGSDVSNFHSLMQCDICPPLKHWTLLIKLNLLTISFGVTACLVVCSVVVCFAMVFLGGSPSLVLKKTSVVSCRHGNKVCILTDSYRKPEPLENLFWLYLLPSLFVVFSSLICFDKSSPNKFSVIFVVDPQRSLYSGFITLLINILRLSEISLEACPRRAATSVLICAAFSLSTTGCWHISNSCCIHCFFQ